MSIRYIKFIIFRENLSYIIYKRDKIKHIFRKNLREPNKIF